MRTLKNINLSAHFVTTLLLCCFCIATSSAATKYVKPTGSDSNSGNSWTQAYQTLQKAIESTVAGDQIWLASGTYYPTKDNAGTIPGNGQLKTFFIDKDIAIYGGFNGTESSLSQRNWRTNIAILSGDVGTVGDDTDNAYHVVYIRGVSAAMRLDGVAVTKGNANGGDADDFNSPAINGIGGGILVYATSGVTSAPTINNCRIYDNRASGGGGAGAASKVSGSSAPTFTNCLFENNIASRHGGAVLSMADGDFSGTPFAIPVFEHCTFYNNNASLTKKVGYSYALQGGGSTASFIKCILWGDPTGDYLGTASFSAIRLENSLSKGGCTFGLTCVGTILNTNPLFVNAAGGDLRLAANSPAIDGPAGEYFTSAPTEKDYDNNNRPIGCYDYGAFESATSTATVVTCYQDMDEDGFGIPGVTKQFCTTCGEGWADNALDCDDNQNADLPYSLNQSGAFNPVSGTGTPVTLTNDQVSDPLPIGFTFSFFGNNYTDFRISSNGFIAFSTTSSGCCSGQSIPNTSSPNNLIALAWDNLDPSAGGSINYFTTGTAPNRKLIVNYVGIPVVLGTSPNVTSQLILYETSNLIEIHSANINGVTPATMGIENSLGTIALAVPGRNSASWSATNDYVAFVPITTAQSITTFYRDMDGDGFGNPAVTQQGCTPPSGYVANSSDCNDNNFNIKPGATEICDGVDNDCDGSIDEGVASTTWYRDMDGDGFGNPAVTQMACTQPSGYVANSNDCNDNNFNIKPGATEICDGVDNDCDGSIDEGVAPITWYRDMDGDGFGNLAVTQIACTQPSGYVANSNDCNDNNFNIKPGATEVCDGVDNDCDGSIDEGVLTTWYRDMDGDTFGNPAVTQQACSQPTGYVANNTDCNDNNPLEKPNQVWYRDNDNDGYAQSGSAVMQCSRPVGYKVAGELTSITGDCNDNASNINPGAPEICDGQDNNCNTITDENVTNLYYRDMDGDGFGNPLNTQAGCTVPTGYVTNDDDCNDNNFNIKPGATEICDGVDNNCNGSIDEGVLTTYYRDMDGDTYGNPAVTQQACSQPTGYVANNTDCNDNNNALNPNTVWYLDADSDGYYTGTGVTQCASPGAGYRYTGILGSGDCNDGNAAIHPGASESCNGVDDNCNSMTDEGVSFVTYYQDSDGDTFGNPAVSQSTCNGVPTGYVTNNTDCDDTNNALNPNTVWYLDADSDGYYTGTGVTQCASPGAGYRYAGILGGGDCNDANHLINPGATEVCDGIDNDCDGSTDEGLSFITYYTDADNDGYGTGPGQSLCANPGLGFATQAGDCNDGNHLINPGATEVCDGIDNDCDGMTDEGLTFITYYTDADNDGYGTGPGQSLCADPGMGFATQAGDCNDANHLINPGATEVCDGIDNDCDGSTDEGLSFITYYTDADNDGYGTGPGQSLCADPGPGFATQAGDCNDNNHLINPAATEVCDGIDNDCDGSTDEGLSFITYYTDADNDGYGTGPGQSLCADPGPGFATQAGDCNDNNHLINPGATEVCDGIDNDCDGSTDEGCIPDYIITTTGNGIIITDITGSSETLEMSQSGGDINFNVAGRTYSLDGGFVTAFPVNVPLAGATFITIHTEAGNDIINIGGFTVNLPSLTINGGTGNDVVNFNGDITFAANANLDVDLQNDHAMPGVDQINILTGNNILLSGTGSVMMTASLNIFLDNNARIETTNGNLTLEANQQPVASTGYFIGINLFSGAIIRSVNGAVSLAGRGGTADGTQYGIENMGTIATTGTGNILLEGAGGLIGTDNDGVRNIGTISATGSGDIQITGTSTGSAASEAFANQLGSAVSTTSGDIKVDADIIYIDPTSSISAGANKVSIAPTTAGRLINLGSDDTFTQLGLTDAELDRITADTLVIGNAGSGAITVSAAITRPAATNMQLISNSNVTIADGGINTAGGTILLDPGAFPATVRPTFNGTDVAAGTLSFGGDLTIVINNTTAGSGYRQLTVSGVVNITGVDLRLDGSYSPSGGETFTIVDNDGSADAIIGTFNGLAQGAVITNFLGSNFNATISYTGGNGNDVVITVINNVVCYADTDGDGFGDPNNSMTFSGSCGTGFVSNADDCNDSNNALNPNTIWYLDADGDNYYTGTGITQCASPGAGYRYTGLTAGGDCNDGNAAINPAATEVCNGIDDNCNGMTDEGLTFVTYYRDSDGDTFGNPAVSQSTCDGPPTGYVSNSLDCNDSNNALNPNTVWYLDADGDGYYTGAGITQCASPGAGYRYTGILGGGDCNDGNAAIHPGASESCNGIDDNCNGMTDEGLPFVTYYQDSDGDTFGNPAVSQSTCDGPPTGYVSNNLDCNDSNNALNPNTVWYLDADGDGYYTSAGITQCASPGAGYRYTGILGGGDCNDNNAAINPAATEICNGIDDDCDGLTDVADPDLMSTPLQMSCPAAQTLPLNSTCSATLPDYRSLANLSGGCGTVTVTQMPLPGTSVSQAGSMIVTITASDQSGNMQSCTLTVNKLDVTPPSVTCFNGSVVFNGQSSIALDADALSDASDNCGIQSISLSPTAIFATQVGQNVPVTVTVTDLSGNTASCISTVSVSGLPEGWSQTPDGVGCAGGNSNSYNPATGVWTATSTNCFYGPPFTQDASSFAQRRLCGDGSITVQVTSIVGGGWAGVVMRESNAPGAKKAQLLTNLSQYHRREFRTATNGQAAPQQISSNGRHWLRIVRAGNQFTLYASGNGTSWFVVGGQNIVMSNCIEMGLIATNQTANSSVTAAFAGVSFTGSNGILGSPLTPHLSPLTPLDSPLTPEFDVFPNPTGGELNVDLTQYVGRDVRIEVYSIEGKLLQFREIEEVQTTVENLNLSQYAGGMYFVKIKSHDLPDATRRVVLQRE